uniref:Uncharacterized protein n=1 Tax=Arundo donax TaxID=35708 RepID=A0A0A9GWL3_ARUDO
MLHLAMSKQFQRKRQLILTGLGMSTITNFH